jgi:hypothetical protein
MEGVNMGGISAKWSPKERNIVTEITKALFSNRTFVAQGLR